MRGRLAHMLTLSLLLVASCGEEQNGGYVPQPAVKLTVAETGHTVATIQVETFLCDDAFVLAGSPGLTPSAEEIIAEGLQVQDGKVFFTGLAPGVGYCAYGVGRKGETLSKVVGAQFKTSSESSELQPYEKGREGAPKFADVTLCTGGGRPNSNQWFTIPAKWDKERFAPQDRKSVV